jgi:hypothetical protein
MNAGISLTKNFSRMRSYVKVNVGYSLNKFQRKIDDVMMNYRQHFGSANISSGVTPIKWMTWVISFGGMLSKARNEQTESEIVKDFMGRISLKVCPTERFTLTLSGEGTYDNWAEKNNYRFFSDINLQYAFKRVTLEFEGNNLFNQKKCVMNHNNNMDIYHLEYDLRPINFMIKLRFKIL